MNFSLKTLRNIFRKFDDFSRKIRENKGRISTNFVCITFAQYCIHIKVASINIFFSSRHSTFSVFDFQETIDNMQKETIMRYVKMGGCQYLRDYRMAQRLKKTAELRKQVMEQNKKLTQKNDQIPFQVR